MQPENEQNNNEYGAMPPSPEQQVEQQGYQQNEQPQAQVGGLPIAPPAPNEQPTNSSFIPASWPGAWGIFKTSSSVIKSNLGVLLMLIALPYVVDILMAILKLPENIQNPASSAIHLIYSIVFTFAVLASIRGIKIDVGQSFKKVTFKLLFGYIAMTILSFIAFFFSILFFVIPAFFVIPRLALAMYFLIDQQMGPVESMKASWSASKGHVGKMYGILGVTIAFTLIAITIIGIPVAIYLLVMYSAALPLLYAYITSAPNVAGTQQPEPMQNVQPAGPISVR